MEANNKSVYTTDELVKMMNLNIEGMIEAFYNETGHLVTGFIIKNNLPNDNPYLKSVEVGSVIQVG